MGHAERYRQITGVLTRHGLGYMVDVLGLERFLPFQRGLLGHARRQAPYTRPEHLRMALEELGTTFIKLGQLLSTRPDLLPPDFIAELSKLQDAAPPIPSGTVIKVLTAEFGKPPSEVFASFDPYPLAAASIGQAHAATLRDGTEAREVVIKVRRPGAVQQVEEDLQILQGLAAAASRRWEAAEAYDLVGLAQEFAQTLRAELDYIREGHNAERFARNFAQDPTVHVPRIYWETTTPQVLTLERIRGVKINDTAALDAAGIDRKELAQRAARIVLKMVFEDGFFHADPHPGNFFIEAGGRIGLIDFGMVGSVDERTQEQLASLIIAISGREGERLVDTFLELGAAKKRVDRTLLKQDLEHLVARYYDQPLGALNVSGLLNESMALARRHSLQLPTNLALLLKTLVMNEGLGVQLDPTFNLATVLAPYAERLMLRQYSPFVWGKRLSRAGLDIAQLSMELPQQLRRILGDVERGGLEVGVRPERFKPLMDRLERLANRIVLGILAAAFINALAVLMSVYHAQGWEQWAGVAFAFAFAFVAAVVLGLYLAWSILRSGRK